MAGQGELLKLTDVTPMTVTVDDQRGPISYCFVRVTADSGMVGYGESCDSYGCTYAGLVAEAVEQALAPLVLGEELDSVERIVARMESHTRRRLGLGGVAAQARSGVEGALWDLAAQDAGRSLSRLLGRVREKVEVYASTGFLEECDAEAQLRRLAPLLDRGVKRVKVRIGPSWRDDLETLSELRRLLGTDIDVTVDGSETFSEPTAVEIVHRLQQLGVSWFEEPLVHDSVSGIERLSARSSVPLAYGEHLFTVGEALDLLQRSGVSVLQPDAATCGLTAARTMARLADQFAVKVVPHICAGPVAVALNLHLAASTKGVRLVEYPFDQAPFWRMLAPQSALGVEAIDDGHLAVPDAPGLGVVIDEDAAAAHPYRLPGERVAGHSSGLPDRFAGDV
ncbi:MAG TPA: mandelate racemase/muconate lactonizing enzyme family protein [Acidimicrobiales bacterium]|nr:mandelate racemase/muconate lactonizing enzyme family protein [Acidimicrobiales bacterium]